MWKDYSVGFIKNNRASSISIMAASLIAALFLSFLCCMFYNFWVYEIENIVREEGDWQGRITGTIDEEDMNVIRNFANVEKAVINGELSSGQTTVVDIYFHNLRTVFSDMPLITQQLGLEDAAASYHIVLLSRYLIHDPQDEEPPLLLTFYLVILIMLSLSLVLIIKNSFAVSMNARIHQFGIFSSIGAAPAQIRTCLLQEAGVLCMGPVLLGTLAGIGLSYGTMRAMDTIAANVPGRYSLSFQYHPLVFLLTILASAVTVLLSAWLPARKLSKMTPLEAIRNAGGFRLKKKKRSPVLSLLFGMEGELAGNALKAQKKALRTSALSLTLSFLGFTLMLCFFALSDISTRYTYFDRYQDVWDAMVTVKNTRIQDFGLTEEVRSLDGTGDCVVYQKAEALAWIPEDGLSRELTALGGLEGLTGLTESREKDAMHVFAPVVILDDESFLNYCEQAGAEPGLDGTIILNRIWDSLHSNFRYREYVPYVKEDRETIVLRNMQQAEKTAEIPVLAYTSEVPVLREEYADYALVQFIPLSLWEKISDTVGGAEKEIYIRILATDRTDLTALNRLEQDIVQLAGQKYELESENRIQEKLTNDEMIDGYRLIIGSFCMLLAFIGIANVFSNSLEFLHQRIREFAQYMSVGLTPEGMRKMFFAEALVIAGRPLLITLPITVIVMGYMVYASHLKPMEFIVQAPLVPILLFCLIIFGFVGLAYYIGGKRMLRCDLNEAIRNDTMV